MNIEQMNEQFSAEVAPSMVLLDVAGRKNKVFNVERASAALEVADDMQGMGGAGKITDYLDGFDHIENLFSLNEAELEEPADQILVYYKSHSGRPKKSEIARVARAIASSNVRQPYYANPRTNEEGDLYVTGSRAVVYSETAPRDATYVAFLVSTSVWYNHNRAVAYWPFHEDQVELFLKDINDRLAEGKVSIAR